MRYLPLTFFIVVQLVWGQSYNWPCQPFDQAHWVNGTFCECRSGSSGDIDHFHDGLDIDLPAGNAVYSVIDGDVYSIGTADDYGINSWVRVGRYAYVHVIPNPILLVGTHVTAYQTILGWTNSWNHIHFKDGYPGSEINPIRQDGGIAPLDDPYDPWVNDIRFYIDGTQTEFANRRVYGRVDIVSRAMDHTDNGPIGWDNGIYQIGYEILDSTGSVAQALQVPFLFDQIPSQAYVHNVYAPGSNTSTYRYIVTNHLYGNHYLDVTDWPSGEYTARVITADPYANLDTLEQSFTVMESGTTAPEPPQWKSTLSFGGGFQLRWQSNSEPDLAGYRLYFSYDLESWYLYSDKADLTPETNELTIKSFSENITIYFRLTAVDGAPFPNESLPSRVYPFRKNTHNRILIVDLQSPEQFRDSPGRIAGLFPGWNYGVETLRDSIPNWAALEPAQLFVILTGNESELTLAPELASLMTVNPVWISGTRASDILLADTTLQSVWQLVSGPLSGDSWSVEGETNTLFHNFQSSLGGPDSLRILADNTDGIVLRDQSGRGLGVWQDSLLVTNFTFASLSPSGQATSIARGIATFLPTVSTAPDPVLPDRFSLAIYPNPFNPTGTIVLNNGNEPARLAVFNLRGQIVFEMNLNPETTDRRIQFPSHTLSQLSSGVYLVRLTSRVEPAHSLTQKMVFLK
ncbi:MAG: T9SS type A sorting domain-containing protein [Fidelibacterota bacterium]